MKKLLLFLTALLPMVASAYDAEIDGIYYNLSGDEATVTYQTYQNSYYHISDYSGSISIPETITYNGKTYNVTTIGDYAFEGCSDLTSVTIPNSVTNVGYSAFFECSNLTSVTIPNSVTAIGGFAFAECRSLTSVTIPESVTSIGYNAFYGCSGLTSVTIPNSVTSIGSEAFYECSSLTSVTIPNSVTSIGREAFFGCSGLTSVTIPESVTSIGDNAFYNCSCLMTVTLESNAIVSEPRSYDTSMRTIFGEQVEIYIIGDNVESIGDQAFYNCDGLTSITIPNSVTGIGRSTFYNCSSLTSITIPDSLTSIGWYAFYGCSGLTSITIPNNVKKIDECTFYNCSGLTSVTIGNSVTSIGYDAFRGCSGLTKVIVPNIAAWCGISFRGSSISPLVYAHHLFSDEETEITELVIPDGVTSIGERAFQYCTGLTSVTIPNSVTSIGKSAFSGCSGLTSATIGNSVKDIGEYAFCDCSGLSSVTIGNSVISIGSQAFSGCSSLTSVTIPNSVTSIGNSAFSGCSSLTSVTIPNSVTSIGNSAFSGCTGLTSITIGNSVTSIGYEAFFGCFCLTSVTIPDNVTTLDNRAFMNCSSLTSITIPNSVASIGDYAFNGCSGLQSIQSEIIEPFTISSETFSIDTYSTATLYVPAVSIILYLSTDGWMNFQNIIGAGSPTLTLTVTDEGGNEISDNVSIIWYDADGKEIGTGTKLNGIADSTKVYYSVLLDETLGRVYREVKMRKVMIGEEDETIICQLEKIGRVMLEGRVSATDIDKTTATVNVRQMLNGKWEQTYTTQTDEQGVFKVEVYDDETDITIGGEGYLDATIHREGFGGSGNVGVIPVNLLSGFAIAANITIQKAVATGEAEEVTAWTEGLNNIEFTLTNITGNVAITDFTVQNGNVIIKTGASIGNEVQLTAKSKQGVFANATTTFTIAEGANALDLQLTELGGIDATCAASDNSGTTGFLYNSEGQLVAKGSYVGETLCLRHLPSGTYTLVSMGRSLLLGNLTNLSDMSSVGLSEGTDYVMTQVTVNDGELTAVNVNSVPKLDETRFYYTSNDTYFNVNKASITAGNYLTFQAHVEFKAEYADRADVVTLTIDLPEGCQMVENSVIVNRQAVPHTINGNRVTMTLGKEQYEGQVRFCVIPTLNQAYTVTAMASFDIDGKVTQPIGAAQFEAKGLSLSVPKSVTSTNIIINGTAKGHSEVSIYDNDVLIGKTSSKADGSWTAECELFKPYSHSFHDIYAKITTETGMELTSETRLVEYDKNGNVPEKVTMLYSSSKIDFDLRQGTTSPTSYSYVPGHCDFTFLADFTRNDSTEIKNVSIKVLNSDGTVRTLPATFDGKQNKWVAMTQYENISRLPQNVAVEYNLIPKTEFYDTKRDSDNIAALNTIVDLLRDNLKDSQFNLIENNENECVISFISNVSNNKEFIIIKHEDYNNIRMLCEDKAFMNFKNDTIDFCLTDTITENGSYLLHIWDNNQKAAFTIQYLGENYSNTNNNRRRINPVLNLVTGFAINGFDLFLKLKDVKFWDDLLNQKEETVRQNLNHLKEALDTKCPDGQYKIARNTTAYDFLNLSIGSWELSSKTFLSDFQLKILDERIYLFMRFLRQCMCTSVLTGLSSQIPIKNIAGALGVSEHSLDFLLSIDLAILEGVGNNHWDDFDNRESIQAWYLRENRQLNEQFVFTYKLITNNYSKCKEDKKEEKDEPKNEQNDNDFRGNGTKPITDPSGYVYEAVTSNRLEGVTVTCYQKVQVEDMYGDISEEAVVWDAEDYSQQNPLQTDETGFYRWDVPQGWWQVKYEKEGYETTYSDWLPVPPPQLDVNIGMKQSTPPTVLQMRGYESGITIDLSKYMRPETMTTDNITVTRNGTTERGSIEFLNAEKAPLGDETFVSKVKFVPEHHFNASDIVVVTVHKEVESYCGVKMTEDHIEVVRIEPEVKSIQVDEELTVAYQGKRELRVLVLPKEASAGKTLLVKTSSEMIASVSATEVTIDQDGFATFMLGGELPGGAVLDFNVDGTDVTATTKVKVMYSNELVASPTASIASGTTVTIGTRITLSCETEDAIIYYTTDGSCPCDENGSRMIYDGTPIIITEAVTIKAMAVVPNVGESDVAEFVYTVKGVGIEEMALDDEIQIYPLPVRDKLNVTAGGKTITSVTVSSMSGAQVASSAKPAKTVTLDVSRIPVGIYVVNVTTDNGNYSRKILKVQ